MKELVVGDHTGLDKEVQDAIEKLYNTLYGEELTKEGRITMCFLRLIMNICEFF